MQWLEIVIVHRQFPQSTIYHYMDDVLLADSDKDTLEKMFKEHKEFRHAGGYRLLLKKHRE